MRWPWQRNRTEANRHQWISETRVTFLPKFALVPGRVVDYPLNWDAGGEVEVKRSVWQCVQCGEEHEMYYGLATVVPPTFGCTPLPVPCAAPSPDASELPVVTP